MKKTSKYELATGHVPDVIIFGQPGIGKTSIACTMQNPVLFDFDRGSHRAIQGIIPDPYQPSNYQEFRDWLWSVDAEKELKKGTTAVIDTVGTLLEDFIAPWLIQQNPKNGYGGQLALKGWGALKAEFTSIRARFKELGCNLVAIAHEREEGDGDARQYRIAVSGGSADILYRSFDQIGFFYMEGSSRILDFNPNSLHIGKNPAGLPKLKVPAEGALDGWLHEKVVGAFQDRQKAALEMAEKVKLEVDEYREAIQLCNSAQTFQEMMEKIAKEKNKTVQVQAGQVFRKAMADFGLTYDKATKEIVEKGAEDE
jgi:hypothetical protein